MLNQDQNSQDNRKCSVIVLSGAPNCGKSTLLNSIVDSKLSIVSPKPQTTRSRIRGIEIVDNSQLIFIDIPGIFRTKGKLDNKLNRAIVETAKNSFEGSDFICFIKDVTKKVTNDEKFTLSILKSLNIPIYLILNKIDLIEKEKLIEISNILNNEINFEKTYMISALKGDGVKDIVNDFAEISPKGPWLYPEDQLSDISLRLMASEITREKVFLNLKEEIPFSTLVETETFEESKKAVKIHQSIYTISDSHKRIILGKGGSMIKKISMQARKDIEKVMDKKIHLFLFVKVRENWMDNKESYNIQQIDH